jgi:hypothetical protein
MQDVLLVVVYDCLIGVAIAALVVDLLAIVGLIRVVKKICGKYPNTSKNDMLSSSGEDTLERVSDVDAAQALKLLKRIQVATIVLTCAGVALTLMPD